MDAVQCNRCKKYGVATELDWKWLRTDIMKEMRDKSGDLCPECVDSFKEWYQRLAPKAIVPKKSHGDLWNPLWRRAKAAMHHANNAQGAADETFKIINQIEEMER